MHTAGFQPLGEFADLGIAPEEDRRVLALERVDSRIGRPRPVPREAASRLVADRTDAAPEMLLAVAVPGLEIDALDLGRNERPAERTRDDREDRLAEGAGLRELDEAPFRL